MIELVDVAFTIYSHNDRINPHVERLQFTNLPMERVKDAIDLLNDDHVELIPKPRTEDFSIDELFPNSDIDDYFNTCQECGSVSLPTFLEKHVSWHNKLLP